MVSPKANEWGTAVRSRPCCREDPGKKSGQFGKGIGDLASNESIKKRGSQPTLKWGISALMSLGFGELG